MDAKDAIEMITLLRKMEKQNDAIARLYSEIESWKAKVTRWKKETKNTRAKLAELEIAVRAFLDETEIEFEGAKSRAMRDILWSESDTEEMKRIGGWKE